MKKLIIRAALLIAFVIFAAKASGAVIAYIWNEDNTEMQELYYQKAAENVKPQEKTASPAINLNISAPYAILIDQEKGTVLYEKSADERCYPASTTKILTALVAIENGDLEEVITVGEEANMAPLDSSKAGLRYGERLKLRSLLEGLMVPSGNDAAYVIAVYTARRVSGDSSMKAEDAVKYFCNLMNQRAEAAGAKASSFVNPDGYHHEQHYTTAYDMAQIARAAMSYKVFRQIVATEKLELPAIKLSSEGGQSKKLARSYLNTNKLILRDSNYYMKEATGLKTGHTSKAGYCLVSSAAMNGKNVIAVIMKSTENEVWLDSIELLKSSEKIMNGKYS